jgi:hypothetical protein
MVLSVRWLRRQAMAATSLLAGGMLRLVYCGAFDLCGKPSLGAACGGFVAYPDAHLLSIAEVHIGGNGTTKPKV